MEDIAQEQTKLNQTPENMAYTYLLFSSNSEKNAAEKILDDFLVKHEIIKITSSP